MKRFMVVFLIMLAVGLTTALACGAMKPLTDLDYSDDYEKIEFEATSFKVLVNANVRSEPKVVTDSADGLSNSFGRIKETGFTVEITRFFKSSKELDYNGAFYGFSVEEILNTPEGRTWFPNGIKDDPDGIVWISASYVEVSYLEASQK